MLKTSHLQELKRRYREMYAPKPEELDEHCGVCGEGGEQGIEEGKPSRKLAQRDVGMECQECGKKFRSKLSTLQYGKTKCPKCKSTDLDFAFGESVEVKEDTDKDEPGTQGDKEEYQKKRKEIAAKFGVKSCSALKDEKERKACYAALDAAHVSDDEEEDEDDDPVGKNEEVEIEEGVSEKDYDSLKKGDIVTIEYKGAMSSGKSSFKVTAKNIVGKAKVGKVTLQSTKNPKGVKHFLYKRGNKVSFAQGDMAASVVKYTIEEVEIDESLALQMKMAASDVFDILRKNKYSAGPQGDTLVRNLVKKSKGKGSKKGDAQWVANKIMKDYPGLKKEEAEIYEGYEKAVLLSLEDEGIEGHFEYGKVVVAKRDVKRAKETLDNDPDIRRTPKIVGEEVDLDEKKSGTGYQLYHKDFSSAMQHAYVHAKKKGFIVDPKEIDDKVATGPKKPSSGKTNRYILGTDKKKNVHVQVTNLDNKRYELNMYIEEVEPVDEGKGIGNFNTDPKKIKKEYEDNEDINHHTENYLLLAVHFGTNTQVKKVKEIMKRNEKQGSTSQKDNDWMYKNIMPYYDKIRNEEVELGETVELQIVMALDDVDIVATEITDKEVTVKKKEVKKAEAALKKSFKGKKVPKVIGEKFTISAFDKIKGIRNRLNEGIDRVAAVELKTYIENDSDLYRQQIVPIIKNVQRKMKSGKYDHTKAPKLWMYLIDNGAKKYVKEFGGNVKDMFPKDLRMSVANEFANEYRAEIEIQGGEMV